MTVSFYSFTNATSAAYWPEAESQEFVSSKTAVNVIKNNEAQLPGMTLRSLTAIPVGQESVSYTNGKEIKFTHHSQRLHYASPLNRAGSLLSCSFSTGRRKRSQPLNTFLRPLRPLVNCLPNPTRQAVLIWALLWCTIGKNCKCRIAHT